jgi:hypothetical protein
VPPVVAWLAVTKEPEAPGSDRIDGPTPNGGDYAILLRDAEGNPVEIVEFAADGSVVMRTYLATGAASEETAANSP